METVTLSTNLVNAVLQYLVKRPYEETAGLIAGIHKESSELNTPKDAPAPTMQG